MKKLTKLLALALALVMALSLATTTFAATIIVDDEDVEGAEYGAYKLLSATDLTSGEIVWSRPIGTSFDQGPWGIPTRLKMTVGAPTSAGPVTTAGGMTFIGATMDNYIRGFANATGEMLWEMRLPAGGQATPMTYMHEGRQYVVIAAGGAFQAETRLGDSVMAYALPEE